MDVDTGTDDALAILYALRHPDLDVLGISCVAGNITVDQAVTTPSPSRSGRASGWLTATATATADGNGNGNGWRQRLTATADG